MSTEASQAGENQRFVKPLRDYERAREKTRRERDDARTFAQRLFAITVVALIVSGMLGAGGMIAIALLRTGAMDRNWGIPMNEGGVQQGLAFQMQSLPPGSSPDLAARLADWPGNAFGVSTDSISEGQMLGRAYALLDGGGLRQFNLYLDEDNAVNSPFTIGRTRSVAIKILRYPTLLPGSTGTWDIAWQENIYQQPAGRLMNSLNCELYLKLGQFQSVPISKFDPDGTVFHQYNPHGYAIESFTAVHSTNIDPADCGLGDV